VEGREREGPKLLLNQGPSEPCYATELKRGGKICTSLEAGRFTRFCAKIIRTSVQTRHYVIDKKLVDIFGTHCMNDTLYTL